MTDRARLTMEQVEEIRRHGYSRALWSHELDPLCDMALRSLERPAGRVVPEGPTQEMIDAGYKARLHYAMNPGDGLVHDPNVEIEAIYEAMLAASPPAATGGWVSVPREQFKEFAEAMRQRGNRLVNADILPRGWIDTKADAMEDILAASEGK